MFVPSYLMNTRNVENRFQFLISNYYNREIRDNIDRKVLNII